jgi:hypothetical protein
MFARSAALHRRFENVGLLSLDVMEVRAGRKDFGLVFFDGRKPGGVRKPRDLF